MKPISNNLLESLFIINNCSLLCQPCIPSLIYRPVSLSDLESLDSEFHQSMVWLKENEIDNGSSGDGGDSSSGNCDHNNFGIEINYYHLSLTDILTKISQNGTYLKVICRAC